MTARGGGQASGRASGRDRVAREEGSGKPRQASRSRSVSPPGGSFGSSRAGSPGTRYEPVNQRPRSTARQRGEQKGNDGFSPRGFARDRQVGQRGIRSFFIGPPPTRATVLHATVEGRNVDAASRYFYTGWRNDVRPGRRTAHSGRRRRSRHPPDLGPVPFDRGVSRLDGGKRQGGARHPRARTAVRHPARPDDAGDGRLAVRRRAGLARAAGRSAAHPQRRPVGAGARAEAEGERPPGEAVRSGRAARQGAAAHRWQPRELTATQTLIQPVPPRPSRTTTHSVPAPLTVSRAIPLVGWDAPGSGSSASSRSRSSGGVAKNE